MPKGLATVDGIRIADRVLAVLRGATDAQFVVSNEGDAAEWFPSLPIFSDAQRGLGPLAGLETALRAAGGASVLVVAWDMPFVTTPLLRGMRALGEIGYPAVVPEHGEGRVLEPLCAFYAAESLDACSALLERGERSARSLFEALPGAITIPERVLVQHGDPDRLFLSVDTQDELEALAGLLPRLSHAPRR
ncbi:MAG: molybdenum cofactor guanylyltransferase [Gemmatimonadota bacterium]|nr:molybdenum cofactor guanylyltransferase [Gemmatimonadota bacterium]